MTTELKLTPFVYVLTQDHKPPSVNIKHVVWFSIKDYKYGQSSMYRSTFPLSDDENNVEAHIVLYESDNLVSVYLQLWPEDQDKISGKLKIFQGRKLKKEYVMNSLTKTTLGWGGYNLEILLGIPAVNLNFTCEINLNLKTCIIPSYRQLLSQNQLSKDLGALLSTEELSDITIKVGDKELKAHKNILSARSPVFNRMFKSDMAETKCGTVEITDMEFEVLQSVLNYIYTDQVDNINTMAEEIMTAAEKYQLDDLKTKCGVFLAKNLTVENAAHRFILADLYRENQLKTQSVHFINRYRHEVMQTEEWIAAKETHSKALAMAFL